MKNKHTQGMALLLALLFMALLTVLVVSFSYEMQVEASLVGGRQLDLEAYVAAKSAVASGLALLAADTYRLDASGKMSQNPEEPPYDALDEEWALGVPVMPINNATMMGWIDDEYGKLNLNALIQPEPETEEAEAAPNTGDVLVKALQALFESRKAAIDPTDMILDWLDEDDEPRPKGAESDYYGSLEVPYACKNGPMDSVEELLLIPGITPEVFFGDPNLEQLPLTDLLTVYGHPQGKVNLNTARQETLMALRSGLDNQLMEAEQLIEARAEMPFVDLSDLEDRGIVERPQEGQPESIVRRMVCVASNVFRIQGDGLAEQARVRIEAYVWRNLDVEEGEDKDIFRMLKWRVIR